MNLHEAYCLGHMIEGALAYAQATGKDKWLRAACRAVDQMMRVNGPEGQHWVTGHQELELALVKLYRYTGEEKYLEYAQWLVEERGHGHLRAPSLPDRLNDTSYCQDDKPVRELEKVTGHAVRAMYYYSGVTDIAALTGDTELEKTMRRLWDNVCPANLYITGGIGQSAHNEGFTRDWSLPNLTAYCETCAAIGMALWNQRMNFIRCERKFADLVEREMYNGILSGISLKGDEFFYDNPLATAGTYHRKKWFGCSCCPTNLIRFIPSVGGYMYATDGDAIVLNQFIQSEAEVPTASGNVQIEIKTNYPWEGRVEIRVKRCAGERGLKVRLPGWCEHASMRLNEREIAAADGYYEMTVREGDCAVYEMEMAIKRMYADERVKEDAGRVAIMRGPVVYCAEEVDNPGYVTEYFHAEKELKKGTKLSAEFEKELLGGVVTVKGDDGTMLVPYCTWDNRTPGAMTVWMKEN